MRKSALFRIRILTGVVFVLAVLFIGRLYQIQILQHDYYEDKANRQYVHTVKDLYSRGSIFFTTKEGEKVSAATVKAGYLLAIDPTRILNVEETYTKLNAVHPLDHDIFVEKANKKDKTYQEIGVRLSNEVADAIDALDVAGVQLYRTQWRYYPGEELSARSIGFVGYTEESASRAAIRTSTSTLPTTR